MSYIEEWNDMFKTLDYKATLLDYNGEKLYLTNCNNEYHVYKAYVFEMATDKSVELLFKLDSGDKKMSRLDEEESLFETFCYNSYPCDNMEIAEHIYYNYYIKVLDVFNMPIIK
jgi:hypothetical protein